MVHQDPSSFWSLVSPHMPIMLESAIEAATRRLRDLGVTDCERISELLGVARSKAYRVCIHSENVLVERRVNPNNISHLMIYLEL